MGATNEQDVRPGKKSAVTRENVVLGLVAILLGLACAAVFAAYRAVSLDGEDTAARLAEFATTVVWPGVLIIVPVAAVVWFGWKANLD